MRIGVLYPDGSLNILRADAGDSTNMKEARTACWAANIGIKRGRKARIVSVDLEPGDVVELSEQDIKEAIR